MKPLAPALGLVIGLAALAGCSKPATAPPPVQPQVAADPGPPLTPNPMPPGYIGRWAVSVDRCATTSAWTFGDKTLDTTTDKGEVHCNFTQATPNETGWIAEGACRAGQGAFSPVTLVLTTTRNDAPRTLAVSGGPFAAAPVLAWCDPSTIPTTPPDGAADGASLSGPDGSTAVNPGPPTGRLDEAAAVDKLIAAQAGAKGAGVAPRRFRFAGAMAQAWLDKGQVVKIEEGGAGPAAAHSDYYYRPAESDPFLVKEGKAQYVFSGGALAAVFDRDGRAQTGPSGANRTALEERLVAHGRRLRRAADAAG